MVLFESVKLFHRKYLSTILHAIYHSWKHHSFFHRHSLTCFLSISVRLALSQRLRNVQRSTKKVLFVTLAPHHSEKTPTHNATTHRSKSAILPFSKGPWKQVFLRLRYEKINSDSNVSAKDLIDGILLGPGKHCHEVLDAVKYKRDDIYYVLIPSKHWLETLWNHGLVVEY